MLRRFVPTLVFVAIAPAAAAQEASYSEDRIAPSRVPPSFVKTAEKEAPGVRLLIIYRDNEKGYRFVGEAADGRTYSVKLDRDGKLIWRRTYTDVLPAKLPKAVAGAVRKEVAGNAKLAGFQAARTSLVERFDALKNETTTYYEAFGHTPKNLHPRIEVEASGKVLRVDTNFLPSTDDYTKREALAANRVPPGVLDGIVAAAPGIKIARVFRVTTKGSPDVSYEAFGRIGRGRGVEVWTGSNGQAYIMAVSVPLREVPRAAFDAIARASRTEKRLTNFRPTEASILRMMALGQEDYELFGDDPEGQPLQVRVNARGEVNASGDSREVLREEAGITNPEARPKDAVAARGFAVLAARFGVDHHWIDVTEIVRAAAAEGRKEFKPDNLPDPAAGRHKSMVLLYSMDGKVGLAEIRDDQAIPLEGRQDSSTLSAIPAQGFAVLAAHFGFDEKWQDVTDAVRSRTSGGRLDFKPAEAKLPDPAPGEPKAMAVAYAVDGKVGLYVQSQWRSTNLPPDAPPVNSDSLLARSIEFPQNPSLVAFTPDGRHVVVGVADGSIRMIDAMSGREAHRFDGHKPGWLPVAVSGNGSLIVSGGVDGVVRIWDVKTEREKAVLRGHTDEVYRVAFSPTNRLVASTCRDKTVRLWDVAAGREVRKLEGHTEFVNGVKFTSDGRQLATASWDRSARIWDVANGREAGKVQTKGDVLGDLGHSKAGRGVFVGAKDGIVRWWQPATGRDPIAFDTGTDAEAAVAVHPDGHRVLIGDKVAAVLWDGQTTHPVLRLEGHTDLVNGVAISPNGRLAATCGEDKTLKIWNLPELGR